MKSNAARKKSRGALPVVGITADFHTRWNMRGVDAAIDFFHYRLKGSYVDAVRRAGCAPVVLPYLDGDDEVGALVRRLDGLVVSGGGADIDPCFMGITRRRPADLDGARRHAFEMRLTARCIEDWETTFLSGASVLGICGGEQLINVLFGGTLVGDIPTGLPSAGPHQGDYAGIVHEVEVLRGSLLHRVTGARRFGVNSTHHQAVRGLGAGLVVSAAADDGVVEAIEATGRFVLGVQWHPEALTGRRPHDRIFAALADAARGGRRA